MSSAATAGSRPHYRPDIDGLRAISIILVLVWHAFPKALRGGFVGVDVFFVISGFLISGIIFDEFGDHTFSLKTFYARRVRRIFPALIPVLIFVFAAGLLFMFPNELMTLGGQVTASTVFAANIYFWLHSTYFAPDVDSYPLLHLWSLGVEEQFYIVWPVTIMALWRRRNWLLPAIIILGLASFALNFLFVTDRAGAFFLPVTRGWELMLGAALAWQKRNSAGIRLPALASEVAAVAGVALIVVGAAIFNSDMPYPGWRTLVPTLGAALIIGAGARSRTGSLLGTPGPVWLGLISYPLYLWHWPLLWLMRLFDPDAGRSLTLAVCAVAVTLAWATYVLVELPFRRGFDKRPVFVTASLASSLAVAALAGLFICYDGLPSRWPGPQNLLTYKFDMELFKIGKCHLAPDQGPAGFAPECFGDTSGAPKRIVMWGDSAVTALYVGMHALDNGAYDIAELTSSACPPFLDFQGPPDRPNCKVVNDFVWQYISTHLPDIVILSFAHGYSTTDPEHARDTINRLRGIGVATVVLVGPPPHWPDVLAVLVLREYYSNRLKKLSAELQLPPAELGWISNLDKELSDVAAATGAIYVSTFKRLCSSDGLCTALIDGEPTASDQFHLTEKSSALIAQDIYNKLK